MKGRDPSRASQAAASHVASGTMKRASAGKVTFKEWRRFQSSSASSVAPSTVTTTTAAKTTAAIQAVAVIREDESGWIFGGGQWISGDSDERQRDIWDETGAAL